MNAPARALPRLAVLPGLPLVLALLLALPFALGGCGSEPERYPPPATYVVKRGDTLYSIAWRHGLDYRDVARWNGIGRDWRIDVGQVLVLSPRARPRAGSMPARAGGAGEGAGGVEPRPRPSDPPPAAAGASAAARPPPPAFAWTWPAEGTPVGPVPQPAGGVGLRIHGSLGQDVRAAGPGRVVYTGAGLRAYGQLVILKHDETYLSAYGHNGEVFVHEGEDVRAGQRIASMGVGPGNQPMLYFEIRVNGRPLDPLGFLPKR